MQIIDVTLRDGGTREFNWPYKFARTLQSLVKYKKLNL